MGMIATFKMVSDAEIEGFLANPESVVPFLLSETEETTSEHEELSIEKAWHAIHFLLCDAPEYGEPPLNFITCGGTEVGEDISYGPARAYTSNELTELMAVLEPITPEQLRAKYNPAVFMENDIYPQCWDEPIEECMDDFALFYFKDLKNFFLKAQKAGKGFLTYIA